MLFTIFFYNFILVFTILLAFFSDKIKDSLINKILINLSFLVIILISALRSPSVGTDSLVYFNEFHRLDATNSLLENIIFNLGNFEPGFITLYHIFSKLNLSYTFLLFILYSFIWITIFKTFQKQRNYIFLVIFFFYTNFLFFTFNAFRQAIASVIIFYSFNLFCNKKYFKFILCVIFASTFHFSALLFLSLFLFDKIQINKIKYWYIYFFIALIVPMNLLFYFIAKISSLIPFYNTYLGRDDFYITSNFSLGVLYQVLLGYIILYYYNKVNLNYRDKLIFNLSLFGNLFYNLFYSNIFISRIVIYFLFFQLFAFIIIFKYLIERKRYNELFALTLIFWIVFIYRIFVNDSGVTPYTFI